ncbi:MAG TPA: FecR domain-containing protein, partial [Opitutaceae bacterium]
FFAGLAPALAQTGPSAPLRVKGQINAARVQGHVEAVSKVDGKSRVLKDGDALSEQTTVVTAPGSSVILVFSNGATVNVASDSNLDIEQFDQDPFAGEIKPSELKAEVGTSTTRLNLTRGELVGKVVHLNVDHGSEFTVQTPVGAAGIRGTTFKIVFRPGPNGKTFFSITTSEGQVVYRGTTSGPIQVPAGKQVVATFDYTPPTTTGGGSTGGTPPAVTVTTTETSPAEEAQITTVVQTFTSVSTPVTFVAPSGSNGTNSGNGNGTNQNNGNSNNNPNSTPSQPAQPAPATTSQAGTG